MITLITGTTHTGKTALAQRLLEKHGWPYLSLDHLKMGLIRSGYTTLTVEDDDALTELMWPIVREMIKTAIENEQHLVIEGCYLPYDWRKDFSEEYLPHIRFVCLVMTERYLRSHFSDVRRYASVVESREEETEPDLPELIRDNAANLAKCREHACEVILIDQIYQVELPN
ncbi:MAG: adenylate kinase [Clostridia bacterium]|nr:adenylate kinase [Clostridia bacterium]